jgi:hypothetical protein
MRHSGRILTVVVVFAVLCEVGRIYWIMPFPGSQQREMVAAAWGLHQAMPWLRLGLLLVGLPALVGVLRRGRWWQRTLAVLGVLVVGAIAWQTNRVMAAEAMFRQPTELRFAPATASTLPPDTLVLGVALAGEATAYPIRLIGYHHQVRDRLGGTEIMVTYCTVCRSGRVFDPRLDGRVETFRLVGMDRWNALFEDAGSGTWWRQANGRAVAGPRRGEALAEIPSQQMTLAAWAALHPESRVLEADPTFAAEYAQLAGYEKGTRPGRLTGRDPGSWQEKSWVVGVLAGSAARAYDWNQLVAERTISDVVGGVPLVLSLGADGQSFVALDRRLDGVTLELAREVEAADRLVDRDTGSRFDLHGRAVDGPWAGRTLARLPAYQEFWHSWRSFRPETDRHAGG